MRLLLDEQMPRQLGPLLSGHDVTHVDQIGWKGKQNGELLELARSRFDVLITLDRNLEYQQRLTEEDIPILVVIVRKNSLNYLRPLVPEILRALDDPRRGQIAHVGT